jgi:hypothetical protein
MRPCPICKTEMREVEERQSEAMIVARFDGPPVKVARVRSECPKCHHLESRYAHN